MDKNDKNIYFNTSNNLDGCVDITAEILKV